MANISTKQLTYNPERRTFTGEASELGVSGEKSHTVTSSKTGVTKTFMHVSTDTDGSGEDVYGWRYQCGDIKLLIIND